VGYSFLSNCRNLTSITLPDGLRSISTEFLQNCYGLTNFFIRQCVGLTSLVLPGESRNIRRCNELSGVWIKENSETHRVIEAYLKTNPNYTLTENVLNYFG
jgi:hypothetical protein